MPEELSVGSVVGNIAKDLDLDISDFLKRDLRIASVSGKEYYNVDMGKGELVVNDRIDRETLCGQNVNCILPLEVVIENPLQLHRVEVEIRDVNDNAPLFKSKERTLKIAESTAPGIRFSLEGAQDPDIGDNSLKTYTLSQNDHFSLKIKNVADGRKVPELVLEKSLDRERKAKHHLLLTAVDGGTPARSGTSQIIIDVLDINDNNPVFGNLEYKVSLNENAQNHTYFLKVEANDIDEGQNGDIEYLLGEETAQSVKDLFSIDSKTGEIFLMGALDYENTHSYRLEIVAKDKGIPKMEGQCNVLIDIIDCNDNPPEISLKSKPSPVREDAPRGTVVALISVQDLDSGDNGKVTLKIKADSPFALKPSFSNHYALVTNGELDREIVQEYRIDLIATDAGSPPLSSQKSITVKVEDVNDNPPRFSDMTYNVYVMENNTPGSVICSVSAHDMDLGNNAKIEYSVIDSKVQDASVASYFYVNSDNGSIYSMHSFDYEKLKVFQIQVQAKDHGSPSLRSNVTVYVFILDQNDNSPTVIYPSALMDAVSHQKMPRFAKTGHLVTKVTAVDADSGHNAWISYRLEEATDSSLFNLNFYTGEVRTKRAVSEQDDASQRLLIKIKDNGEPAMSITVTVSILIEDGLHELLSDYRQKTIQPKRKSEITFYLIISLASVSVLSLITFLVLVVKCVRNSRNTSSCCIRRADSDRYKNPNRNLQIQLNTDGPIKYVEVLGGDMLSQSQSFRSCLSPMSEFSDFTLVKPSSAGDFNDTINVLDASLPDSAWTFESQQVR
ncbi:protocadherin gamma-C5-like [Aplochiton taeniatus]